MPFEFGFPLREYQQDAIRAVEQALADERRSMLLAMATGTGKTKLAIALLYRLLATKRFRRSASWLTGPPLAIRRQAHKPNDTAIPAVGQPGRPPPVRV